MLNKVTIIGNLGQNPEIKDVNGQSLTKFSVACSRKWKSKEGESKEHTEWVQVVCWGKLAELTGKYLNKGAKVYVEGRLQTRSWEGDDGIKRYATDVVALDVVFLDSKSDSTTNGAEYQRPPGVENKAPSFDPQEEIPF